MILRNNFDKFIYNAKPSLPKKKRTSLKAQLEEDSRSKKVKLKQPKVRKKRAPTVY